VDVDTLLLRELEAGCYRVEATIVECRSEPGVTVFLTECALQMSTSPARNGCGRKALTEKRKSAQVDRQIEAITPSRISHGLPADVAGTRRAIERNAVFASASEVAAGKV
jgi:hypothetical protein